MVNTSFVLKEPNGDAETLVYMLFRFNGEKFKYSTSQKIHPNLWSKSKQRAKELRTFSGHAEFNSLLTNLETIVNNDYRKFINDKITPTRTNLKINLDAFLQKKVIGSSSRLIPFAEELVEKSNRKISTKRQLSQTIKNLKEFQTANRRTLFFDDINLAFYDEFVLFMTRKKYAVNTIGSTIKNLKVFLNEALDRNLTSNVQFRNKRFKKMQEQSDKIYLTSEEITKLYNQNLNAVKHLERARDLFIIGCFTGLRFSDLNLLTSENFIENQTLLKIKTQKTGELVIIPLHSYIKEILAKYGGKPPEIISNEKMNKYLKEIGESAKINNDILISSTKGGKQISKTFKKFELITVHTARRSFATNAYINNIPSISIMKITGHRTEKAFLTYIKISQEDNARKLMEHSFFNIQEIPKSA